MKLLPSMDLENLNRFQREVNALAVLRIPGVARLTEEGIHEGRPYLVMELARGLPFPGDVARADWATIGTRTVRLLEILGRVHDAGVVHRDLKPANVLVDDRGNITIVDFGLARGTPLGPTITSTGIRVGTPRYAAPEQLLGHRVDGRADLYALGVMLHELLAGVPPFPDDDWTSASPQRLIRDAPPVGRHAPDLPWAAQRLIDRLLARDPARRPRSAGDALGMLAEDRVPGARRLPWLGSRAPIDHLVAAAREGRPADLWGAPGSGRSRCVAEAVEVLQAEGRTVVRARHGERPVESLRHLLDAQVQGASGLGAFEKALRARLSAGDVLVVDTTDGIDAWSLSLVAHARSAGAVIRVVGTPDAHQLAPLSTEELRALFRGPDRVLHLREDAANLLLARTQGLAGRVSDELGRWLTLGRAAVEDGLFVVDSASLAAIQGEPALEPTFDEPLLEEPLATLLRWVVFLSPGCTLEALTAATQLPAWEVQAEVEDLEHRGAVRRLSDGRIEPARSDTTGALPTWDDETLRQARRLAANALPPGAQGRLAHLLAAGDHAQSTTEALVVATAARAEDRQEVAMHALDAALVAPGPAVATALAERLDLAFEQRDVGQFAQLAERARRLLGDHPLTRLAEETAAASQLPPATGYQRLLTVPPLDDPRLEGWRHVLLARYAIRAGADFEPHVAAVRAADAGSPAFAARAHNLLGLARYTQLRFAEAAQLHEAAAAAAQPGDRPPYLGNASSAWLTAFALDNARRLAHATLDAARTRRCRLAEARAVFVLRQADYQEGITTALDPESDTIAEAVGDPHLRALLLAVEASVAWRIASPDAVARAQAAEAAFNAAGVPLAALLYSALVGYQQGGRTDAPALVQRALASPLPWLTLQVLALVAATDRAVVPVIDARARTVGIPPDCWDRRLEILSAREAVALLEGQDARALGLPTPGRR